LIFADAAFCFFSLLLSAATDLAAFFASYKHLAKQQRNETLQEQASVQWYLSTDK